MGKARFWDGGARNLTTNGRQHYPKFQAGVTPNQQQAMFPAKLTDRKYLADQQYRSAANLKARIQLHERFSTNRTDWFQWVFDQLDLPAEARILELGCGPGDLWLHNAGRISPSWQITLTDLSSGMAGQAGRALTSAGGAFFFLSADAQAIPAPGASYEAVIANHMLYHVPDRTRALAEIQRVLQPGGRLYAATNSKDNMRELRDLVARFAPGLDSGVRDYPFSLENGAEQLVPWFQKVEVRSFENALKVTEAAPLVEYVLSMAIDATGDISRQANDFFNTVQEIIDRDGSLTIGKDVGLFVARRE